MAVVQSNFIFGVYMQPPANFAKWRDRGMNVVITDRSKPDQPAETPASRLAYFQKAYDAGLGVIIGPDPAGSLNDLGKPSFLAYCQPDEPENWGHVVKNPDGSFNWPATTQQYRAQYDKLHSQSPAVPVYGNFNGGPLLSAREVDTNPKNCTLPTYREFAMGADWVSADFYIAPTGRPPEQFANYGKVQDRLVQIAPDKPHFSVVECCHQGFNNANARHPTPSEVRAACWIAVIHGATGLSFFPLKAGGGAFTFDNTPADVAEMIPQIATEIRKYEKVILHGSRVKSPTSEEATWNHPDGSQLLARATFDSVAKLWAVHVEGNIVYTDPEKEQLKKDLDAANAKIAEYEHWITQAPK